MPVSADRRSERRAPKRESSSLLHEAIDRAAAQRESGEAEVRALVDATFDVIAATGSLDPPIREIFVRAGLGRQVFYRHFASKDELLIVVLDESRQIVAAYLAKRIANADGAVAKLRAWIDGVMRQAQHPEASRRTRPFAVADGRLVARFPVQYAGSQSVLTRLLASLEPPGRRRVVRRDRRRGRRVLLEELTPRPLQPQLVHLVESRLTDESPKTREEGSQASRVEGAHPGRRRRPGEVDEQPPGVRYASRHDFDPSRPVIRSPGTARRLIRDGLLSSSGGSRRAGPLHALCGSAL